jgi:hypothetical protein
MQEELERAKQEKIQELVNQFEKEVQYRVQQQVLRELENLKEANVTDIVNQQV